MWLKVVVSVALFALGAALASFFGVVIDREPNGESVVAPPSHCPACGHKLKWFENIPIFSWLFLRGRCRCCKQKIGAFYPVYEFIGGACLAVCVAAFGVSAELAFAAAFAAILVLIAGYDFRTNSILDAFWIALAAVALGWFFFKVFALGDGFARYLIGAAAGFGFFGAIKLVGALVAKRTVLGGGDVIVMGVAGLVLGWQGLILAVLISSVFGALFEAALALFKVREQGSQIAFCPYLALGIYVAALFGDRIINSFLELVI